MVINTLYLPELREMLAENDAVGLREFCTAIHPARVAEFMEGLEPEEAWRVLQHAESPLREQIFSYFDTEKQQAILAAISPEEAANLVANLPPDERVDLLKAIDPELASVLLAGPQRGPTGHPAADRLSGEYRWGGDDFCLPPSCRGYECSRGTGRAGQAGGRVGDDLLRLRG